MAGNLSVVLSGVLQVTDIVLSPSQQIVTRSLNNPTLNVTVYSYTPFFQAATTVTTVTLPAATVYVVYVKNLSSANNLTVNFTPTGGSSQNVLLLSGASESGGIFLYFQTAETGGGITALSLAAANATSPAEVFVAA